MNRHMIQNMPVYTNSIPLSENERLDQNFQGRSIATNSMAPDSPIRIRRSPRKFLKKFLKNSKF